MLPKRIAKPPKREMHCCEHCGSELVRKGYEEARDYMRRRFCDKTCASRFISPYVSRSEKLLQNSASADDRGCWNWMGNKDRKGYGRTTDQTGEVLAHRLSYIEFVGQIPEGLHILHSCDNPSCINPSHLRAGTNDDNTMDRIKRGRSFKPSGERNPKSKLREDDVLAIRASLQSRSEIAAQYGVSPTNISMIRLRKTWKDI